MTSSAFTPTQTQITNNVPTNVPVVNAVQTATATVSNVSTSVVTFKYVRFGDTARVSFNFNMSSNPTGTVILNLPSGMTIDTTKVSRGDGGEIFGVGYFSGGATGNRDLQIVWNSSTSFIFRQNNDLTAINASDVTNAEYISGYFTIPVAEWAGSGTTTLATRAVEDYASNGGAAGLGTSDLTDFKYGPSGSLIGNLTSGLVRRVRFPTAILATDNLIVEVSTDRVMWFPMTCMQVINTAPIDLYTNQNGVRYGMGRLEKVNSTDVDVTFGLYSFAIGATYGSAGSNWATAGAGYWRVRRVSAGSQIGYPVSARNIIGDTSGTTVPTGMIGELATGSSLSPSLTSGTPANMASITLQPGTWEMHGQAYHVLGGTTTIGYSRVSISTTSAAVDLFNFSSYGSCTAAGTDFVVQVYRRVTISSPTTYYLVSQTGFASSTCAGQAANTYLTATRIA